MDNKTKKALAKIEREVYNTPDLRRENTDRTKLKCKLIARKAENRHDKRKRN